MSISKQLRRYRGWIALAVLIAIGATAYVLTRSSGTEEAATTYTTEAASIGTLSVTVSGTGNIEVDGTTDVYPDTAGTVATVKVDEGDSVTTGTVLFTLDSSSAEANTAKALASYRQAQQGVAQAEAQVTSANNNYDTLEARYEDQQSSTSATTASAASSTSDPTATTTTADEVTSGDLDAAKADITSAKASLVSAKAQRSTAYLDYQDALDAEDDLSVTAPCSGIVYTLGVEEGDSVSASSASSSSSSASSASSASNSASTASSGATTSDAPVVIAPEQPLAVHLTVNEVDLPTLKVGQRADVEFDALPDVTATGKVYSIGDEGTSSSGVVTFDVWVSLDVANENLRAGMSAAATVVTEVAKDALTVPNGAVKTDSTTGGYYVQVLADGATTPTDTTVEVGLSNATDTQILSGLSEGDKVVTTTSTSSSTSSSDSDGGSSFGPGAGGGMMQMGGGGPQ